MQEQDYYQLEANRIHRQESQVCPYRDEDMPEQTGDYGQRNFYCHACGLDVYLATRRTVNR